ncbi:MAG TPA: MarR family winged helix-turn-helix transcriptional regulator [Dehalococcoidales bacterium]|nr:MarR family winged helix-turn-helix transcriptional regulator [Dehalococcoidales bacterium]
MPEVLDKDQDFRLWTLLTRTRDAIFKARAKELSTGGISNVQAAALFAIRALGNEATPAELSRWLLREPHSVSGLISRMEAEGLIKKAKDLPRKNMVRAELTEKGQQAYEHSTKRASINRIMSSLSEKKKQQLSSYLETLRGKAHEELGNEFKPPWP